MLVFGSGKYNKSLWIWKFLLLLRSASNTHTCWKKKVLKGCEYQILPISVVSYSIDWMFDTQFHVEIVQKQGIRIYCTQSSYTGQKSYGTMKKLVDRLHFVYKKQDGSVQPQWDS